MKINNRCIQAILYTTLCCTGGSACAGLFRWVDDNGNVHYSDSVPPSASQGGHAELSHTGITLKQVPAAKSAEQAAEEDWLDDLEAKRRKSKERQQREDNQLLSSYSDVDQFDKSHATRIAMIQDGRKQLELLREKLKEELVKLQTQLETVQGKDRERVQGFITDKQKSAEEYDLAIRQNLTEEKDMQLEFEKQRTRFLDLLEKKKAEQEQAKKTANTPSS